MAANEHTATAIGRLADAIVANAQALGDNASAIKEAALALKGQYGVCHGVHVNGSN